MTYNILDWGNNGVWCQPIHNNSLTQDNYLPDLPKSFQKKGYNRPERTEGWADKKVTILCSCLIKGDLASV